MVMNQAIDWQGKMLGRYRMLQRLKSGGMGQIWQAEDSELRRLVAIKILPSVLTSDTGFRHAFVYEARAAASLTHPHILAIHAYGEQRIADDEVITYLVMPYLEGGTLRDLMRRENYLTRDMAMNYLRQAAEAIDYAHSCQVLHRDIKPANMLVQGDWLYLSDFGIAKILTSTTYRSKTYAGSGTPEYMAPEQIQGQAIPASDRYSLAVTAYQIFTGMVPFSGESPYDIMIQHLMEPPIPPREINPALPTEVEAVILQGMAKRPEERPASSVEFINALDAAWNQAHINRITPDDPESTLIAPWSDMRSDYLPTQLTSRPSRTNTGAPTNGQTPATPQSLSTTAHAPQAVPELTRSEPILAGQAQVSPDYAPTPQVAKPQKRGISRRNVLIGGAAALFVAAGGAAWATWAFWPRSAAPTHNSHPLEPGPKNLISGVPTLSLAGHKRQVSFILWSPDGTQVATAGADHAIMVWDTKSYLKNTSKTLNIIKTSQYRWRLDDAISYYQISWAYNGKRILALSESIDKPNVAYAFDLQSGATDPTIYTNSSVLKDDYNAPLYQEIACSPKEGLFVTSVLSEQSLILWDLRDTQQPIKIFNRSTQTVDTTSILAMNWASDGKHFAVLNSHQQLLIFDNMGNQTQIIELTDRLSQIDPNAKNVVLERFALQWNPNNPNLIAVSNIDVIDVWDIQQKRQLHRLETDDPSAHDRKGLDPNLVWYPQVYGLSWSPNGRYIAASFSHSTLVHIWDLNNQAPKKSKYGNELQTLMFGNPGHTGTIMDLAWQPGEGRYIATAAADDTAMLWRVDA